MSRWFGRWIVVFTLTIAFAAQAAEVGGILVPERLRIGGTELMLNGYAQRTATLFRVPIYVASLYVEHPSRDRDTIVHSADTKVLRFRFQYDVSIAQAQESWRKNLIGNCIAPCQLDQNDYEEFLAHVPAMKVGDTFDLHFTKGAAKIVANGDTIGHIDHPKFAEALLLAFLGPNPGNPEVQSGLLGNSR